MILAWLQQSDLARLLASIPAFAALLDLLWQVWRDQLSHEREKELKYLGHDFTLAVASNMANLVFDKQVKFTEQYVSVLQEAVPKLFSSRPSSIADEYATKLKTIRTRYSPWISQELATKLEPYEKALRRIATDSKLAEVLPVGPQRTVFIKLAFSTFRGFLGIPDVGDDTELEDAPTIILRHLQDLLGIGDLETLRRYAIRNAADRIREK